ncbi:MAG: VanZ family protein [Candidatus Peribacteria bacterium]|nr:VanZ family protein [Candidatus Peribacteria bacterium]
MLSLLFSSPLRTLYAFGCTIVLCVIFQLCFLLRAKKREGQKLSVRHFVRVFILLFYLAMVYKVTGMGTVWIIGRYPELIRMSEIYWIPFLPFEDWSSYLLNVVMTIPLGILLPLIWSEFRSLKKITLTGFLFSLAIELSQLLNRRATATEDLIMNTLGIVVGYLIFRIFYKIFSKKEKLKSESHNSVRDKRKVSSPIVKHEAIWYLVLSFLGMFLFYGSISLSSENHEIEV